MLGAKLSDGVRNRNHVTKSQFDNGVNADYYKMDDDIKVVSDKNEDGGKNPGSEIGTITEDTKKQDQHESIASSSATRSVAELDVSMRKQIYLSCSSCVFVHSEIVSHQMNCLSEMAR